MKKHPQIGVLCGAKKDFSLSFIKKVNEKNVNQIQAEFVKIGGIPFDYECPYQVIIDRTAYKIPYYKSFLKSAILSGCFVINDPFWFDSSDRFFHIGLLNRIGLNVPKSICLPSKSYGENVTGADLGNMIFPLDWEGIVNYIGLPAIMKPYNDLGWKNEGVANTMAELLTHYNQSGSAIMILQEHIAYDYLVRCVVIGENDVLMVKYNPDTRVYLEDEPDLTKSLELQLKSDSLRICKVLGFKMNTVDVAITDKGPVIIDFMNPVPAMNPDKMPPRYFEWVVDKLADFAIEIVQKQITAYENHHWYQEARLKKKPTHKKK